MQTFPSLCLFHQRLSSDINGDYQYYKFIMWMANQMLFETEERLQYTHVNAHLFHKPYSDFPMTSTSQTNTDKLLFFFLNSLSLVLSYIFDIQYYRCNPSNEIQHFVMDMHCAHQPIRIAMCLLTLILAVIWIHESASMFVQYGYCDEPLISLLRAPWICLPTRWSFWVSMTMRRNGSWSAIRWVDHLQHYAF